jgi:hypothetical protein
MQTGIGVEPSQLTSPLFEIAICRLSNLKDRDAGSKIEPRGFAAYMQPGVSAGIAVRKQSCKGPTAPWFLFVFEFKPSKPLGPEEKVRETT